MIDSAVQESAPESATAELACRLHFANRGVWESVWWLGSALSTAHTAADGDTYLTAFRAFLGEVTA
jgi:hypothetical protein